MPDTVDARIPLMAGQGVTPLIGANPNALMQLQQNAIRLQQQQQIQQGENALRQLYGDPSNVDPSGNLVPEARNKLWQLSPAVAMDYTQNALRTMNMNSQLQYRQAETVKALQGEVGSAQDAALNAYDDAVKKGMTPQAAQQVGQSIYSDKIGQLRSSGLVSPDLGNRIPPNFNPDAARASAFSPKERMQMDEKGWEVRTDYPPGSPPVQYRYNAASKQATDLRGNPYTPSGMAKPEKAEEELYKVTTSDGKERIARRAPGGGFIEDETGKPLQGISGARKVGTSEQMSPDEAGKPTGPTDLHGEDYLKALPESRAAMIKGYSEGRVAFPGSFSLRSPYWQKMVADITQYDPNFDAVNYNARAKTRADFTGGKGAANITSINTAIGHIGSLYNTIDKLNNSNFPWWNTASNFANVQLGNARFQAAKKEFEVERQAVADELTRAFRQTGGNVYDIKGWEENINSADSPTALKSAVKTAVDLLRSRIESVNQQYQRGMGTTADVMDLLSPKAKKTLEALPGGDDLLRDTGTVTPGVGAKPVPPAGQPAGRMPMGAALTPDAQGIYTLKQGDDWQQLPPNAYFRMPGDPPDKARLRP